MDKTISPLQFIDHRNQKLWDDLTNYRPINVAYHEHSYYGVFRKSDTATIYVPDAPPCKDSFTHELLHLWMSEKDCSPGRTINATFKLDRITRAVLGEDLIEHITNSLEHIKMLPIYIEMGFDRTKFLEDYFVSQDDAMEIRHIRAWINHDDLPTRCVAVRSYIGKYFGMRACVNPDFNYSSSLKQLSVIDQILFNILDSFWQEWLKFDVYKHDPIMNSYRSFSDTFIEELQIWLNKKFT